MLALHKPEKTAWLERALTDIDAVESDGRQVPRFLDLVSVMVDAPALLQVTLSFDEITVCAAPRNIRSQLPPCTRLNLLTTT